ncbi:hypothetical protein BC628DRAFT_1006422 [Trametes gibbosa]|nr:hypothetical protein BC628DRAFT_1006422 [Trametes gibbosa]
MTPPGVQRTRTGPGTRTAAASRIAAPPSRVAHRKVRITTTTLPASAPRRSRSRREAARGRWAHHAQLFRASGLKPQAPPSRATTTSCAIGETLPALSPFSGSTPSSSSSSGSSSSTRGTLPPRRRRRPNLRHHTSCSMYHASRVTPGPERTHERTHARNRQRCPIRSHRPARGVPQRPLGQRTAHAGPRRARSRCTNQNHRAPPRAPPRRAR